jgi:peptide/nickel transport system permease protein
VSADIAAAEPLAVTVPKRGARVDLSTRVAAATLGIVVAAAILAPLLPIRDPNAQSLADRLTSPNGTYLLGTDDLGRDQLSRLVYGLRISLRAALEATGIGVLIGAPLGLASGHLQGWVDRIVTRVFDAIQSVPPLILAMAIVAALGRDLTTAMLAVGVAFSPRLYRITRGVAMSIAREDFVEASRSVGAGGFHIISKHTLPNVLSPLFVQISITIAFGMLAESSLSFLGLGVQPPKASLGSMLKSAASFRRDAAYLMLAPGLLIVIVVLSLSVLTEALRRHLVSRGQL